MGADAIRGKPNMAKMRQLPLNCWLCGVRQVPVICIKIDKSL